MFEKSSELLSSNPMERNACIEQLTQNEHVRERERFACRSWVNQSAADVVRHL